MGFHKNVFVNCPFDTEYVPLLRPLLFTIKYLGLTPQIASESIDSGKPRITRIIALIKNSRYAIHDLSRLRATKAGEYFRLNMPFELGIDVGCTLFKRGRSSQKTCLILEAEKYRYQAAISDLSNSDIAVHRNKPVLLVREVRNWLEKQAQLRAPGPSEMWGRFNEFMAANHDALRARGFSKSGIRDLPVGTLIECIDEWMNLPR